jgi:hypothetical protein
MGVLTMTLKTNGLNWLAQNAGSGNCFASSGINYRDADGVSHTGGTKDVVNAFVVANMVGKTTATIIAGTHYNNFKEINDDVDLAIGDVAEAADREADGGTYPRYCVAGTMVCTPGNKRCKNSTTIEQCKADGSGWQDVQVCPSGYTCQNGECVEEGDKPVTGPLEVYVGGGQSCDPGTPSVTLDTSEAYAFFKSTPHEYIGVGGIMVHNKHNTCRAYFAWEARIWDGYGYTTCPTTDPIHQEINRFLAEAGKRPLSLKRLDASGTDEIWGSFETLPTMEGEYTLCLSLWGNFDYEALIAELNAEGYFDKI